MGGRFGGGDEGAFLAAFGGGRAGGGEGFGGGAVDCGVVAEEGGMLDWGHAWWR
jgi:hypothetical protein